MKIKTQHVYPPIPIRDCNWTAIDDDTYDGPGSAIGVGATEQEAIDDLVYQLRERRDMRGDYYPDEHLPNPFCGY